jgi:branched-chain amino acid transport system permease protein
MELIQQLVNGISLGSIYALIALGYTMVYGSSNCRFPWRRIHGRFIYRFYAITVMDLFSSRLY